MKESAAKERSGKKTKKQQYSVIETDDFWFATGPFFRASGTLFFCKRTQQYHASFDDTKILFSKLAKANYASQDDCPVDLKHRPKPDFLMLLALRASSTTRSPGREWNPWRWREMAIRARISEREKVRGKPLPEGNQAYAMEIAKSWSKFETHVGQWLADMAQQPDAGRLFRRFAGWLDALVRIESEGIPENYLKFFRAVEAAAFEAKGVPTKKSVKTFFVAGLSANQIGLGDPTREMMRRLRFNWLPSAGRGSALVQKISGGRSAI
ncbi:MAG: hypothetical protein WCO57_00865 [Verrucomicrobiota bacterium]